MLLSKYFRLVSLYGHIYWIRRISQPPPKVGRACNAEEKEYSSGKDGEDAVLEPKAEVHRAAGRRWPKARFIAADGLHRALGGRGRGNLEG